MVRGKHFKAFILPVIVLIYAFVLDWCILGSSWLWKHNFGSEFVIHSNNLTVYEFDQNEGSFSSF